MIWRPSPSQKILPETRSLSHAERKFVIFFYYYIFFSPACCFNSEQVADWFWNEFGLWKFILNLHWEQISLSMDFLCYLLTFPDFAIDRLICIFYLFLHSKWVETERTNQSIQQMTWGVLFYSQYSFPKEACYLEEVLDKPFQAFSEIRFNNILQQRIHW